MTRSTRYFLIGSALVVTLGLGTGLVAYYNGGLPGLSRTSGADLGYMPGDAAAVAYADVRAIMDSEFRQKLRRVLPSGEELNKIRTELGVDIERDIDTVAAAYLGGSPNMQSAVVIVRGRFDQSRIEATATQHGAVVGDYNGKRMLTMDASARQEQTPEVMAAHHSAGAVAFLEPGVLAIGEIAAVKKAIDAGASGDDIRKNTELVALIEDLRGSGNAWFVGRVDAMTSHAGLPSEIKDHMPAINLFAVSVHINGGVSGVVRAEARDEKAAEQLRDVVRGALAAGQLVSGKNPKVDAMLSSLQITGSGKTVGLSFSVPPEMLDVLNGIAAAHQLGSGK